MYNKEEIDWFELCATIHVWSGILVEILTLNITVHWQSLLPEPMLSSPLSLLSAVHHGMIYLSMSSPLQSPSPVRDIYKLISPDSLYVLYIPLVLFCLLLLLLYCLLLLIAYCFFCYVICLLLFCIPLLLSRVFTTHSAIVVVLVCLYFFSSICIFLFFFFFLF